MKENDRRFKRTEEALHRAMMELILEKGFEATSVAEITARANIGRSTFYLHYADKEDLLQGAIELQRVKLKKHLEALTRDHGLKVHPALAFSLPMFEHALEFRETFLMMTGRKSGYLSMELFHDMLADTIRENWRDCDETKVQALAGGWIATVNWWLSKAPEIEPSEIDRRFRELFEQAILSLEE